MSFLRKLEKISFKNLLAVTFLIGLGLAAPITVWVSQQKTQLSSKAAFEKPEIIKPVKIYGNPSAGEPKIDLVWPFLGKKGDAVLIEGENFGNNPQNKQLFFGGRPVSEDLIHQWTPELIEFVLPDNALSGTLSLNVDSKTAVWPYWFTVYDLDTNIQITENNDIVRALNAPEGAMMEIFFSDGSKISSFELGAVSVPSDKTIISVTLKNSQDQSIPFFVEPAEFNF